MVTTAVGSRLPAAHRRAASHRCVEGKSLQSVEQGSNPLSLSSCKPLRATEPHSTCCRGLAVAPLRCWRRLWQQPIPQGALHVRPRVLIGVPPAKLRAALDQVQHRTHAARRKRGPASSDRPTPDQAV